MVVVSPAHQISSPGFDTSISYLDGIFFRGSRSSFGPRSPLAVVPPPPFCRLPRRRHLPQSPTPVPTLGAATAPPPCPALLKPRPLVIHRRPRLPLTPPRSPASTNLLHPENLRHSPASSHSGAVSSPATVRSIPPLAGDVAASRTIPVGDEYSTISSRLPPLAATRSGP